MLAWTVLGLGTVIGAWWAYVEFGWGSYWAWDPVENAAVMPWLLGTALLHSLMVQRHRGILKVWNMALLILAFHLALLAVVLALSVGYLVYAAFPGSTRYYLTVSELLGQPEPPTRTMRVLGKLAPDSFQRDGASAQARFVLTDGSGALHATYRGVVPDLFFNPQSEIVLGGKPGPGNVFQDENVIVKCPSKYQPKA